MSWEVLVAPEFQAWLASIPHEGKQAVAVDLEVLRAVGPQLGRPQADHIKDSKHSNMKELRTTSGGNAYRILFAFDPFRRAVLLIGGDKNGQKKGRFYAALIKQADAIYDRHLKHLKKAKP
jgi:hypothetical protein